MARDWGPFLEIARIQSEINRLFDNLLDLRRAGGEAGQWIPNVDIAETEDAVMVKVELAGVHPEDLEIVCCGSEVVIQGERRSQAPEGATHHVCERAYGRFRRTVPLTVPVNTRQAEASFVRGLLAIRFPKVPNRRGEAVRIPVGSGRV